MEYLAAEENGMEAPQPQFDVILRFEPEAEAYFQGQIEKLAWVTGNTVRLCSGQPPHVSLGIFYREEDADPVQGMEGVLRSLQPFSVTFAALGAFLPGTLIALPIVTEPLIAANKAIHAAAGSVFRPLKQYVFGTWVPHLTLAAELPPGELTRAFEAAAQDWKPLSARTVSVSLVHHFPYTEELVVPLL